MIERILYLAGVVAVAWLVTFALRAFPFLVFAGKDRDLPPAVERAAGFISPLIIAGLIVYSYYGLYTADYFNPSAAWAWPVLAGLLTVALQLWRRNPLMSIIAGTVLYMALVGCAGCSTVSTETFKQDRYNPLVSVSEDGIKFQGRPALPEEAVKRLQELNIPLTDTVYILVEKGYDSTPSGRRALWVFQHNYLNRAGYSHVVMIHPLRSESGSSKEVDPRLGGGLVPFGARPGANAGGGSRR